MLIVISPAKSLELEKPYPPLEYSVPSELKKASQLIKVLKKKSREELSMLMDISAPLAQLNFQRYKNWQKEHHLENSRPAIFTFDGDVYDGFQAFEQSIETLMFANQHLRILSGLYGVLKPFDLIQAFRLEMGTSLNTGKELNLYSFWGKTPAQILKKDLGEDKIIIQLASEEYFKAVQVKSTGARIIQPIFMDFKTDKYKVISFFAKRARGKMAAYICKNQLENPEDIQLFNEDGYYFNPEVSDKNTWVFYRD